MNTSHIVLSTLIFAFSSNSGPQELIETNANYTVHTVQPGESMWKIALEHQIGLSEIVNANPHIKNPRLIYPNQQLNVPNINEI